MLLVLIFSVLIMQSVLYVYSSYISSALVLTSNANDINMKQNEASILANFLYWRETNLAYSRILKDRSEANSAYSRT